MPVHEMSEEKVRELLIDREDWRFVRRIIVLLLCGALLVAVPFVCVKIERTKMEAQGYEWVNGGCECFCPSCECEKGHWESISN